MAVTDIRPPAASSRPGAASRSVPRTGGREPVPYRPHAWLRATILTITLLAALSGMHVVITETSWWFVGALFIVLVMTTATLVRQLTRPSWLPTVAGGLVGLVALTVGWGDGTALLAVIPLPSTIARFVELNNDAWVQIAVQAVPATPEPSIVFLLAAAAIGIALIGDITLRLAPALTSLPILTLLVVPVAVAPDLADPFPFVLAAIGYLVLLRIGRRRVAGTTLFALGAMVVAGSFVLSSVFPPVQQGLDQAGGLGVATGINPLINLGDDLRRGAAATAVTYTTSDDQGMYLRLATLSDFDGDSWSPELIKPTTTHGLTAFPVAPGLTEAVSQTKVTAKITVGGIQGQWLPVPYPATKVTGTTGSWFWEPQGLSVRSADTNVGGQSYTASYLEVEPDLAQLRASTTDRAATASYLALPQDMPQIIADTAQSVAGSAATDYDKALALQNYFTSSQFTYSTTAPVRQGYDGTGADVIAEFLQKKAGYCVHFASAMAVMARVLGIPSRVAVGFQPGSPSLENGKTVFTVSTHQLHAWPELYFAGIGWLRFEPTPGQGVLPDYSDPAAVAALPSDAATDAASSAATSAATPTGKAGLDNPTDPASSSSTSRAATGFDAAPLVTLILLAILLAAAFAPAIGRRVVRWRRERAIERGRDPAANAWAEVRDTARDHGWWAPDTETAREFAARLSMVLASDTNTIDGLRGQVEATAYGRPDAAPISLHELRELRRAIAGSVSPRERVRAFFLPASLLARIRFDPDA